MSSAAAIIRRRRRRKERKHVTQTQRHTWTIFFSVLLLLVAVIPGGIVVGSAASVYLSAAADVPDTFACRISGAVCSPSAAVSPATTVSLATTLTDRTGATVIHTLQDPLNSDGAWVALDTLPVYVAQATLTVEDPDFLQSGDVGTIQALVNIWQNIWIAPTAPDYSISGRLARNVMAAGGSRTFPARNEAQAHEIALAAELHRRYTPEQLLEWHLNTNYYGNEAYGIEAAAQTYLGKRAVDLSLDEAALLASIPTAPQYNPFDNEAAARGRQQDTLRVMLNTRLIGADSYDRAIRAQTVIQRGSGAQPQIAPEFNSFARRQAENILTGLGMDGTRMVARGGIRIVTTLDSDLQAQAECTLDAQIARLNDTPSADALCAGASLLPPIRDLPRPDDTALPDTGMIVIMDARTGELRALVGSATRADHQPGVTLQPIVYLEGFNGGNSLETPATMVFDIPTQFPGASDGLIYTAANGDGRFRGVMNLREAMGSGRMPPAAAIAYRQGMSSVIRTAHHIGINSLDENNADLMLLERGGAVSLLDVTYAYSVFAALGHMRGVQVEPLARGYRGRDPAAVLRIEDASGAVLWSYDTDDASRCATFAFCTILLQDGLAYLVNDILADQQTRWSVIGQGSALDTGRAAAVVNGLTGDRREQWTVGYTPDMVIGAWMGTSGGEALRLDEHGMSGTAAVWRALIDYAHGDTPAAAWERPDEVIEVRVCDKSGLLPNGICPVEPEVFMDGTEPGQQDTYWQTVQINNQTGQRATANTQAALRTDAVYFVPPDSAMDWWRANNQPLPPDDYDTVSSPEMFDNVRITSPGLFAYIGGEVEIFGTMDTANLQYYQLSYGEGLNPPSWNDITPQMTAFSDDQPLGVWDTRALNGLYSLLLVRVSNDNVYESEAIQVTVDNTAPTVALSTVQPGIIFRFPGDETVELIATVQDDYAINRVEFFRGGQFLGADEMYPFGFAWEIDGVGDETFSAVAFDEVGNQANAQLTVEIVRAGS